MANFVTHSEGELSSRYLTDTEILDRYVGNLLWTWGLALSGQLGNGSTPQKYSPVQTIAGGTDWVQVACGGVFMSAIKNDGSLWAWGRGTEGQLGNNAVTHRSSPVQTIAAGTNWKQVSCGNNTAHAIKTDGSLWNWGRGLEGQLGNNAASSRSSPVQTIAGGTDWRQVSAGNMFAMAVKLDGTLWGWGHNGSGNLGTNNTTHRSSPVQTVAAGTDWEQVACGAYHSAAVKTDGTLWTWGRNTDGQLGDNTTTHRSSPVQTVSGNNNWKQVVCGNVHTAALKTNGTLWLWGYNGLGGLGDNTTTSRTSPQETVAGGRNWKGVFTSQGASATAGIKTDGSLWVWGDGMFGGLGDNAVVHRSSPVQTSLGGRNWKQASLGTNCGAAVTFKES
jgi:alpha-tubulin suppressor-like RCC1 family protein